MSIERLALSLVERGFRAKVYRNQRVYLSGYGRDISAWLELVAERPLLADGALLYVRSNWRSPHNGLRCKGVKHAILKDLHSAGFISESPPDDWRRVTLDHPRLTCA